MREIIISYRKFHDLPSVKALQKLGHDFKFSKRGTKTGFTLFIEDRGQGDKVCYSLREGLKAYHTFGQESGLDYAETKKSRPEDTRERPRTLHSVSKETAYDGKD